MHLRCSDACYPCIILLGQLARRLWVCHGRGLQKVATYWCLGNSVGHDLSMKMTCFIFGMQSSLGES